MRHVPRRIPLQVYRTRRTWWKRSRKEEGQLELWTVQFAVCFQSKQCLSRIGLIVILNLSPTCSCEFFFDISLLFWYYYNVDPSYCLQCRFMNVKLRLLQRNAKKLMLSLNNLFRFVGICIRSYNGNSKFGKRSFFFKLLVMLWEERKLSYRILYLKLCKIIPDQISAGGFNIKKVRSFCIMLDELIHIAPLEKHLQSNRCPTRHQSLLISMKIGLLILTHKARWTVSHLSVSSVIEEDICSYGISLRSSKPRKPGVSIIQWSFPLIVVFLSGCSLPRQGPIKTKLVIWDGLVAQCHLSRQWVRLRCCRGGKCRIQ